MRCNRFILAGLVVALALRGAIAGEAKKSGPTDTAGLGGRPLSVPVDLDPAAPANAGGLQTKHEFGREVTIRNWAYSATRNPNPRDGVPWLLLARPVGANAAGWRSQVEYQPAVHVGEVPVTRVPAVLWKTWFDRSMQDVVGIHYHEFMTNDLARVLVTVHKVPADAPDPGAAEEPVATRLEATLLTPLTYSVDQTIIVRSDQQDEATVAERAAHERGHAEASLQALLDTLAGPQTWRAEANTGRRATLKWYWRSSRVFRRWDTYRDGKYDLATLRTSITLVPPTRWSILIPVPPQRLDPDEIQRFNDDVVLLTERYFQLDRKAQDVFHGRHGAFEQSSGGR